MRTREKSKAQLVSDAKALQHKVNVLETEQERLRNVITSLAEERDNWKLQSKMYERDQRITRDEYRKMCHNFKDMARLHGALATLDIGGLDFNYAEKAVAN
jgi:vacuolar-type H+-ATPase subunit E/Vma4